MEPQTSIVNSMPESFQALAWILVVGLPVMWLIGVLMVRDGFKPSSALGPIAGALMGLVILFQLHRWPFS